MDHSIIIELDKFSDIIFNESDHSYYMGGAQCLSVTSLISKFKKPFETEKIAKAYAAKNGLNTDDVIEMWRKNSQDSMVKGSELHKYAEYKFFGKHYDVDPNSGAKDLCRYIDDFRKDSIGRLIPVRAEMIVGDESLGLCGMIDKLFYNISKGCFQIWDYKTNKKIATTNPYGNRMTNGLSHLEDCEFNTYSLQTSVYRRIIERKTNIKLGDSYVCWINDSNESYKVIKMDYMSREAEIMFNSLGA